MTELVLSGVTAGYGSMHVLEDVNLSIRRGERVSVVGRNGAGKTTLLLAIMGLCRLHAGTVRLDGHDIEKLPAHRRARAGLGLVPQTRDVFASLTVEENLLSGLKSAADSEIGQAYDLFPRLRERCGNLAGQLSGGEQQMLSIARALLGRPTVLLLDEPLEGLAPIICQELMDVFSRLAGEGSDLAVVLVEQHLEVALNFADRTIVLDRGRIVFEGASAALRQSEVLERSLGLNVAHATAS